MKRVMMSMALVVPVAALEAATNASTLASRSASLRGSSMVDGLRSGEVMGRKQEENCADNKPQCGFWAADGLCDTDSEFMHVHCRQSCGLCQFAPTPVPTPSPPASDPSCTASFAHNCSSNPTCCEAGFTCYQQSPSWAACLQTCTPGMVQRGDEGDQIPWTCAVIGGGEEEPTPTPVPTPSPPASDPSCTASFAHNCSSNPTCCEAGFTCYQQSPSWAACLQTCTPGMVQRGDEGEQIPWTCAVIGGGEEEPTPTPVPTPSPPASDPSCSASFAHNCSSNPTCCEAGFTCYQQSPSWAACLQTCTPGMVQRGDEGEQIPWTCAVIGGGEEELTPTPVPTPSSSTSAPSHGPECTDENEQCGAWAAQGDCTTNSGYMNQSCRLSCGLCQTCADEREQCGAWAAQGECTTNPAYMRQTCRLSCGFCQTCADQNDQCAEWVAQNQCAENPEYMHAVCKESCGLCN